MRSRVLTLSHLPGLLGGMPALGPLGLIPVTMDTTLGWLLLLGASLRKLPGEPLFTPWLRNTMALLSHRTSCH